MFAHLGLIDQLDMTKYEVNDGSSATRDVAGSQPNTAPKTTPSFFSGDPKKDTEKDTGTDTYAEGERWRSNAASTLKQRIAQDKRAYFANRK